MVRVIAGFGTCLAMTTSFGCDFDGTIGENHVVPLGPQASCTGTADTPTCAYSDANSQGQGGALHVHVCPAGCTDDGVTCNGTPTAATPTCDLDAYTDSTEACVAVVGSVLQENNAATTCTLTPLVRIDRSAFCFVYTCR